MPRLFTGIEVPAAVAERLAGIRGGLPGARWIDPEDYHLTLRFIGDIDTVMADAVAEGLARVSRAGFALRLADIGTLGTRKPRAIVARAEASAPLVELQAQHERIVQRAGLPPEGRKFTPHVTVARLRRVGVRAIAEYLALRGGLFTGAFTVNRFVLFSSRDSVGGGPYVIEQAYPLEPQAALAAE